MMMDLDPRGLAVLADLAHEAGETVDEELARDVYDCSGCGTWDSYDELIRRLGDDDIVAIIEVRRILGLPVFC